MQTKKKLLKTAEMAQSVTGNAGPKVRSDIEVTLEITGSGGLEMNIKSKDKSM